MNALILAKMAKEKLDERKLLDKEEELINLVSCDSNAVKTIKHVKTALAKYYDSICTLSDNEQIKKNDLVRLNDEYIKALLSLVSSYQEMVNTYFYKTI